MIENSADKKKIFYMIVLILTFVAMIIGATLAYFSLIASQEKEGTVLYTGTLQINYIDGTYIKNPELIPTKNVNYNTTKGVYRNNFAVTSSGTLDQTISVELEVSKNEFTKNGLKYAIYNSKGGLMNNGYVPQSGKINLTNNIYLKNNDSERYTLIVWLDNTNYNQNYEMGNIITGKINIYAKQIKY